MITLHFNPQFDSGAWSGEPGKGCVKLNEKYVGPLGLLAELELRLGVTAPEKPQHEVLAAYTKSAQETAERNPSVFFAESLKLAPLETAGELLKWRDELVLSGWKASSSIPERMTSGAKTILAGLAEVESSLPGDFRTVSSRWRLLLDSLASSGQMDGFSVVVHAPESNIHPVFRTVLENLRRCGVSVSQYSGSGTPKVKIKHFHDSTDAYLWTAAQDGDALVVCADEQSLSSAMSAFGHPHGRALSSRPPRDSQPDGWIHLALFSCFWCFPFMISLMRERIPSGRKRRSARTASPSDTRRRSVSEKLLHSMQAEMISRGERLL